MDYVFKKVELGRRTLNHEWKVEWTCDISPTPVLYIRKLSMVAYAEVCGAEEVVNNHWPRIANAAVAAGVWRGSPRHCDAQRGVAGFRAEFENTCMEKQAEISRAFPGAFVAARAQRALGVNAKNESKTYSDPSQGVLPCQTMWFLLL